MQMTARRLRGLTFCLLATTGLAIGDAQVWAAPDEPSPYRPGPLLTTLLNGDLAGVDEIVFAVRVPGRDHWYVNFGYYSCDYGPARDQGFGLYPDGESVRGYGDGGRLCRLNQQLTNRRQRLDPNMIPPSGRYVGSMSSSGPSVNCRRPLPSMLISYR